MLLEREVGLDFEILKNLFKTHEWSSATEVLNGAFQMKTDPKGNPVLAKVSNKTIDKLCEFFMNPALWDMYQYRVVSNQEYEFMIRCGREVQVVGDILPGGEFPNIPLALLRALRNSVTNQEAQDHLATKTDFLKRVKELVREDNPEVVHQKQVKVALGLLSNFVNSNSHTAQICHDLFYDDVKALMQSNKCVYESSALLYNIYLNHGCPEVNADFCQFILRQCREAENNEYFIYMVARFYLTSVDFWKVYSELEIDDRVTVLKVLKDESEGGIDLPDESFMVLRDAFQDSGSVIMQAAEADLDEQQPFEVTLLIEVVADLVANEQYRQQFAGDKDMLVMCGSLLYNIHRVGKVSNNYFTAVQRLKDITEPSEVMLRHPAFGLKVKLVKIVANLCWKNKEMQDLARKTELIPVLLDCCNIDARNPFIMQWIIFAIRNLCDGNIENQKVIAGLHREGVVSSAELEEVGLTLHNGSDGKIKVAPIDALRGEY